MQPTVLQSTVMQPAVLQDEPKYGPAEIARFTEAANFYRKSAFPQGDAAAAAISDPIMRTGLDWIALRVAATPARLDAFQAAHPDWPLADWTRSVREGWLFSGKPSPTETSGAAGAEAAVDRRGQRRARPRPAGARPPRRGPGDRAGVVARRRSRRGRRNRDLARVRRDVEPRRPSRPREPARLRRAPRLSVAGGGAGGAGRA